MRFFVDTADYDEITTAVGWGVVSGITTNPTLIARAGQDHETQVKRICELVGDVSAETVTEKKEDLIVEGRRIASWHKNVIVKVASTPDGLAAGKVLAGEGIKINVTLCFTVNQALLAAAIGAYFISPFVGRLDDIATSGMELIRDIVQIYDNYEFTTEVLVASCRHPIHIVEAARLGADICTCPPAVIDQLFNHPLTSIGLEKFLKDWEKAQTVKA